MTNGTAFPRRMRQRLSAVVRRVKRSYARTLRSFSSDDLADLLGRMGVTSGDTLLVHVSFDSFIGFSGTATDVLDVLRNAVGTSGTLMMPTMPFTGSAVDYARENPVLDLRRTPSRMGLITELFRRSPDVVRSLHPTHPVAAWGAGATSIVADHHMARTPCGRPSPFARLTDVCGKILFLGADVRTMTFFHTAEEMLEQQMPFSPFTEEVFSLETRDADGMLWPTETRLFDPDHSRRRRIGKLVPELKRRGNWSDGRVGSVRAVLLSAPGVMEALAEMADRGVFCYED